MWKPSKRETERREVGAQHSGGKTTRQLDKLDKHITPAPEDKSPPLLEIRENFNRNMNLIKLKFKDEMMELQK